MLSLVGLGLNNEKDLTLRGIELAKSADKVYIELYTNLWKGKTELEKIIGKEIVELKREDLEQKSEKIVEESKSKDVVVFIPGDPMVATTHIMLVRDARKQGIKVNIVHNSSIISAIAETGLHIYKFGATATVPFPEKTSGNLPNSVYDVIKMNKKNGLHTLLLLDILPEKCMTPNEAIEILLKTEQERKENVFTNDTDIVVFARAGSEDSSINFGRVKELTDKDFGKPPMVIIVPSNLHFSEKALFTNEW
jgi:diphthine synthase